MQCKFVPSKDLKTVIKDNLNNNTIDPLAVALEQTLAEKLISLVDDLM
jgi:hypothetical protein